MSTRPKREETLSEEEIDQIVAAQADDDSAWEEAIHVHRTTPVSSSIPADLAARAAFLAGVHREADIETWLTRIIQERVELEEAAFVGAKRDFAAKNGPSYFSTGETTPLAICRSPRPVGHCVADSGNDKACPGHG